MAGGHLNTDGEFGVNVGRAYLRERLPTLASHTHVNVGTSPLSAWRPTLTPRRSRLSAQPVLTFTYCKLSA